MTYTPSDAAKAAAIFVFTSGVEDHNKAVAIYDRLDNEDAPVSYTLENFSGVSRWSPVEMLDDSDWWSEVTMLAQSIDNCRKLLPPRVTFMVCYGNTVDGHTFVGPFDDRDAAVRYAESEGEQGTDWCVATIYAPAEGMR